MRPLRDGHSTFVHCRVQNMPARSYAMFVPLVMVIGCAGASNTPNEPPIMLQSTPQSPSNSSSVPAESRADSTPEDVKRVLRENIVRLRGCYNDGLRRRPNLAGRVVVKFIIGESGSTLLAAADASSDLDDTEVVSCIVHTFESFSFPRRARAVKIIFPLKFQPGE